MLKGGFNFTLEKSGSIKIVVGPYTSSPDGHIFPSLYEIKRDSDLKIESYKKIDAIYSQGGNYTYQYSDNSATIPSGTPKLLDLESLYKQGTLKQNCAYYIEIPLNSGDYWFGPDSNVNKCPYILYFDIGANAGEDGGSDTDTSLPKVDFVYYNNTKTLVKISDDGYIKSQIVFKIASTASGVFEFNRTNSATVLYYIASGNSITPIGDSKEISATPSDSELTEN